MYISFTCQEANGDVHKEITTFYGIRYNRNGFAVLSTDHNAHDYLLPMTAAEYEQLATELEQIIAKRPKLIRISTGEVYRVRRGALLTLNDKLGIGYTLESLI